MPDQVLRYLQPRPGGRYVDLTLGMGGHARRVLESSAPDGQLLGVDRDPAAVAQARQNLAAFGDRCQIVQGRFSDLSLHLERVGWSQVDGMLADLGVSSLQLDRADRGFSFQSAGPLDMRMDPEHDRSLAEHLAELSEPELTKTLRQLGEVVGARGIARRILSAFGEGRIEDTAQLAGFASERSRRSKIHPATRVFMALRMMVNRELDELSALLADLPAPLKVGGRVVFLSFHSLEDRLIKKRFQALAQGCVCPPKLPVCRCDHRPEMLMQPRRSQTATPAEIAANPRARSARLRVAERLAA